ncbi:MAG: D-alanine--D-alanine ligase [Candidatus Omnitrophica bacterium]|nr:D-alanine--D-alanine ligase [Candidatus Omnitrophota bacterium]
MKKKGVMRIGVLMGGISSEREISLKSGKAVVAALQEKGYDVVALDILTAQQDEVVSLIKSVGIDLAFITLHGEFGEDGKIQSILENMGVPYTGSGVAASRIAMNKILTQALLKKHGLPVPEFRIVSCEQMLTSEVGWNPLEEFPVVVKPACEGSSIGVTIVQSQDELVAAMQEAFQYGDNILVEQYIQGREITAAILENQVLPLVEIRPKTAFFDFQAKYQKGLTDYLVPAELPENVVTKIRNVALAAFKLIGCRDFARMDFIVNSQEEVFFLEANTIPGFTGTSLLPMAAQHAGYDFPALCSKIVELTKVRSQKENAMESEIEISSPMKDGV